MGELGTNPEIRMSCAAIVMMVIMKNANISGNLVNFHLQIIGYCHEIRFAT
jgi:hypothetical protein